MPLRTNDTLMLMDALRPPAGMEIAAAVGTTFTLDLAALLAIPVAASFGESATNEDDGADLLESIRRYSSRTLLFCQAGGMGVPSKYRAAHTFLEDSVVGVKRPEGGIFHPKVWAVRFEGSGRTSHRILVLSRNLTYDRAWDVVVRLEEDPETQRVVGHRALVEMLDGLRDGRLLTRRLSKKQQSLVDGLVSGLRGATFAAPEDYSSGELVFWKPGKRVWPFMPSSKRALAISPFLTRSAVHDLLSSSDQTTLVSRGASLDGVAQVVRSEANGKCFRIRDSIVEAQVLDDEDVDVDVPAMRGLHAKVFVQDGEGRTSSMWLGSANLTDGAFSKNFEMSARLDGPTRLVGVHSVLGTPDARGTLATLIEPHELADQSKDEEVEINEADDLVLDLASRNYVLEISGDDPDLILVLHAPNLAIPDDVLVAVRLLSLRNDQAKDFGTGSAEWTGLNLLEVTPFVVVSVNARSGRRSVLVRADLPFDVPGRKGAVVASAIKSPEDFLRYLAALLGATGRTLIPLGSGRDDGGGSWIPGIRQDHILEDLLTTASRSPKRLASLNETLSELRKNPSTAEWIPVGFSQVWDAVYSARKAAIR